MKKVIIFSAFCSLFLASCDTSNDSAFDATAEERIKTIWRETEEILCAAPNGWSVEYFYDYSCSNGGLQMFMKFNDGSVDITSELVDTGFVASSLYSYAHDVSATINFDTYNSVLHYFNEPSSNNVYGYGGDFEFTIMEYSEQKVVLRGKRNYIYYVLTPLAENLSWTEIMTNYKSLVTEMERMRSYTFNVDGSFYEAERVYSGSTELRRFTCTLEPATDDTDAVTIDMPFVYTFTGLKFYTPYTFGEVSVQEFDWTGSGFADYNTSSYIE